MASSEAVGVVAGGRLNVLGLEAELHRHVEGEVRFDDASRALYATDASNFRQVPIGVVVPATLEDVVATSVACARYGAPLLSRGGGTSMSGEAVNVAVVLDFSKYLDGIEAIDARGRTATVQAGVVNEQVNLVTGAHDLVFGPDPSTHSRCTIGGNVGNNSCGPHSLQSRFFGPGSRTSDNIEALEILTYEGERFWVGNDEERELEHIVAAGGRKGEVYAELRRLRDRYADDIRAGFPTADELPRRVSGYNLDELLPERGFNVARALVGTEGTCVTVLRARIALTPAMLARTTVVLGYDSLATAAGAVPDLLTWRPIALEGFDRTLVRNLEHEERHLTALRALPRRDDDEAWLLVQFGADEHADSQSRARAFAEYLDGELGYDADQVAVADDEQSASLWEVREAALGAVAFPPGGADFWPGWEDSAVPPARLAEYLRDLEALCEAHGLTPAIYGHFGEGCVHARIDFDLRSATGLSTYRSFLEQAADLVVSHGGSISGEHGDGQQRAELLTRQFGDRLVEAMGEFKRIWDPRGGMNPGKVVDPDRFDEHLRLGTGYNPARPAVRMSYPEDGEDFAHAALRCIGIGACREPEATSTMCPSYRATREEKHSTRGRARLLFEMLQGEVITDGWRSKEVEESLDLCLACKGCTNDCPVNVDIPTYKAEFRYHHYRSLRRARPRHAYVFGFIDQAARVASSMPGLVNALTQTPGVRALLKAAGGIDQRRALPTFAPLTLQRWFAGRRRTVNPNGPRVVLFPDTFNNHLHTDVGVACVETLEAAGWHVVIPDVHVCCGRPLYDYGFLDAATRYLDHVIEVLREDLRAGTPIVGMEPSCLAVFKDELRRMRPHDDDAARLAQNSYHLAEFLETFDVEVPALTGEALLWGHCHQRATGGTAADERVLERLGVEVRPVTGGCCGLAGSWGFESGKFDISVDCGEQALLPAVRAAEDETAIVANGFSCMTQIEQVGGGRRAVHLAQLLAMARGGHGTRADERDRRPRAPLARRCARAAALGTLAAVPVIGITLRRRGS